MNTEKSNLNIVVALHCEAKPLIHYFKLKKITETTLPFPVFVNKEKTIHLVLSGVGKIKAAAATAFLSGWTGNQSFNCFLNAGIAGSSEFDQGDFLLINKITENSTSHHWYPFVSGLKKVDKQSELTTFDLPQSIYPSTGLIDMEASAFFQTAACFVTQEQIQVVKIISDCDENSQAELTKEKVEKLISAKIETIAEVANYLKNLSTQEALLSKDPHRFSDIKNNWHFSHTQTLQLREYLRRWQVQVSNNDPLAYCLQEKNAHSVLNKLITKLNDHANCLY